MLRRNVLDVALPGIQLLDLGRVDVEAQRLQAGGDERVDQRQADVPQADDADDGLFLIELLKGVA